MLAVRRGNRSCGRAVGSFGSGGVRDEVPANSDLFAPLPRRTAAYGDGCHCTFPDADGQVRGRTLTDISGTVNGQPHFDPLELLTIAQVVRLTKRARSSIYEDIAAGRLQTVKLGRSTRIPRMELDRYIAAAKS